ncbi:MAG: hypothetical protein F6K58_18235 [Symploca sp. SIO2E9]|nr:hypothetical protein [Symploca sp. SIO2E9]
MNTLPQVSTSVLPLKAYINSPRVKTLTEVFGEHLEGISKEDKWVLISAISQTLHHCQKLSSGQIVRYSVVECSQRHGLIITSLYPINPIAIAEQMKEAELKLFVEFLVCDLVNTEILSPTDPRFIHSYEHYSTP